MKQHTRKNWSIMVLVALGGLIGTALSWTAFWALWISPQAVRPDFGNKPATSTASPADTPGSLTPAISPAAGLASLTPAATDNLQPTSTPFPTGTSVTSAETREDDIIVGIAEAVLPSVVGIHVEAVLPGTNLGAVSEGSGIVITSDGYIVTNNHVINQVYDTNGDILANSVISVFITQNTSPFQAAIVGRDVQTDLALLKIEAAGLAPAKFGDSDRLQVGELAVAIGSPSGLQLMGSVTSGIISGLNRAIRMDDGTTLSLIQTDAAVNSGNSGGALINREGNVIGINNAGLVKSAYEGINFAIPSNTVLAVIERLRSPQVSAGKPWLGISVLADADYDQLLELYDWPAQGVCIKSVQKDSPAEDAGLQQGDIVVVFDQQAITGVADLTDRLNRTRHGDEITVIIYRPSEADQLELTVILGEMLNSE